MPEPFSDPLGLTVVRARGRRLCKLIRRDGAAQGYDLAKTLDLHAATVPDLPALAELLRALAGRQDSAIVRGAIADPARTRGVRRLLHPDAATGEAPTLRDVPRAWIALDLDGMPLPAGCDPCDLEACGAAARRALPAAFQRAACLVAATASHVIRPGARLRLWARLARPLAGAECQRWLRDQPACDPSTLRAAQIIYTAAPVFVGMADPLPERLVVMPGEPMVAVPSPAELAPRPPSDPPPRPTAESGSRYALAALSRAAVAIATAPVDSRHPTAVREAWGLARLVHGGLLTEGEVIGTVDGALQRAGKPKGEGEAIARWAVTHRPDAGLPAVGGRP
ncbi:hypothetical protein M0638_07075 [Roseomonas sp. NAR14]|uniref:Uncharacterized protein n=1 Tax=Roseomonas acroporae TaxID=2937791 RepID=A0A9X2BTC2_9PROT|nr:hypothetical protein [Roseomonas acroporae]MCK8784137.1 hypothetical protein [Roseomonas acroporae]